MIRNFLKSSAFYFAANALNKVVTFSFWIYLARVLTVDEMGRWSLLNVFVTLLTFFMSLELTSGFNRFYLEVQGRERRRDFELSFLNLMLASNLVIGAGLFLAKPLLEHAVFAMGGWLFLVLLLMPITQTLTNAFLCKLRLEDRARTVVVVSLLQAAIYVGVSWAALHAGEERMLALFLGLLAQNVVVLALYAVDLRGWKPILDFTLLAPPLRFSLYLFPSFFGAYLMQIGGKYILGRFADTASLGIFEANSKIAMILGMFMDPLYLATTPVIFKNYKESGFFAKYRQIMNINAFALLALVIPFGIFGRELVKLLAGAQYAAHSAIVFPLLWVAMLSFFSKYLALNEHLAKKTQYDIIPGLGSGLLNVGFGVLLIGRFGIWGAAGALIISYLFFFSMYCIFSKLFLPSLFLGWRYLVFYMGGSALLLWLNYLQNGFALPVKAALCLLELGLLLAGFFRLSGLTPAEALTFLRGGGRAVPAAAEEAA